LRKAEALEHAKIACRKITRWRERRIFAENRVDGAKTKSGVEAKLFAKGKNRPRGKQAKLTHSDKK